MASAAAAAMVVFPMMVAFDIFLIGELPGEEIYDCLVGRACTAAVELDSCFRKCHLCTAADAAADQDVGMQFTEHAGQSPMPFSVCADDLRRLDRTILRIVHLEESGPAKVLEYIAGLIVITYCNSHWVFLHFLCQTACSGNRFQNPSAAPKLRIIRKFYIAAADFNGLSVDQRVGNFFARISNDILGRRTRNVESGSTLRLVQPFQIHKPDSLQLIQGQTNGFFRMFG